MFNKSQSLDCKHANEVTHCYPCSPEKVQLALRSLDLLKSIYWIYYILHMLSTVYILSTVYTV